MFLINSEKKRIKALKECDIKKVWGIGRQHAKRLKSISVNNAYEFTQLPLSWVRKEMTVVGERIWRELNGEQAIEFKELPKPKKGIGTAKSFGKKLEDLSLIEEACAYYISEVSEVLRNQQSCASYLQVFLHTNYHSERDKQYSNSITVTLPIPTHNTFVIISEAKKALHSIYRPGYRYKKVGVNLSGIIPQHCVQGNLFSQPSKIDNKKLIGIVDDLNKKYGKAKVMSGLLGVRQKDWELVKNDRSPRYTTQWDELITIK